VERERARAQCTEPDCAKTQAELVQGDEMADTDARRPEGLKKKGYSPAYFAQKHRISLPIARALIEQFGDDRDALNQAAQYIRKV